MKRGLTIGIFAVIAGCAVAFGVHHEIQRTAQMRAAVDSALVQNRNYVSFTSDSTLKEVTSYFDHPLRFWITANDRLRAHYALGCVYRDLHDAPIALLTWEDAIAAADTTAADCDFATLFRIYGQMASIYFRQSMPEKELEARNKLCNFALLAGDTINYIRGLLMRDDAFLALGDTAAIYRNIANVRRLYLQRGLKDEAAQVYPMAIRLAIDKQQFVRADSMMQIFEQESGLFDEQGNIAPTREIYYYHKGLYYLGVNQLDSAELQFRHLLLFPRNIPDAYRGLLFLYQKKQVQDSIYKYSILYEGSLTDYLNQTKTTAINLVEGMYNYNLQQQKAQVQELKANRFSLALVILAAVGIIISLLVRWEFLKKKEEKQKLMDIYLHMVEELNRTRREKENLHESLSKKEVTKRLLEEKGKRVKELETVVEELQKQIGKSGELVLQQNLEETTIVKLFRNIAQPHLDPDDELRELRPGRAANKREWRTMIETIRRCHPKFYLIIQKHNLSELKMKVCILSYLGFDTPTIATLLDKKNGSISNARIALAKELFNLKSAHDLNAHLLEL